MPPRTRHAKMKIPFPRKLVLNRWALAEFGMETFAELARSLGTEPREGLDESNVHWFHHELCTIPREQRPRLSDDTLLAYDQAIVAVTQQLNENRLRHGRSPIQWKYFQYLSLLFTEIYLERYFTAPEALRASLNAAIHSYNDALPTGHALSDSLESLPTGPDPRGQLNKLAFWMATGSGKTLLMHAHILRYRELTRKYGQANHINRILLLTPNEGLSQKVRMWQDIALALLKKYVTRYWGTRRQAWEAEHLEYRDLRPGDGNFPRVIRDGDEATGYRIVIATDRNDAEELRDWIESIRRIIESGGGPLPPNPVTQQPALDAVAVDHHLYSPLLVTVHEQAVTVSPPGLNAGEHQFVKDFRAHCERTRPEGQRLHLLRNMSRGHGIGFFEANNFHPDFILWAVSGDRQHIAFVDPKGLVRMDASHAKVQLATQISEIEERLGDPHVRLDSFILSVTPFETIRRSWNMSKTEMAKRHVLFMAEDRETYVGEMLERMGVTSDGLRPRPDRTRSDARADSGRRSQS